MKIKSRDSKKRPLLREIEVGDLFRYQDKLYMRIRSQVAQPPTGTTCWAVVLENGEVVQLGGGHDVERVEGAFIEDGYED